MGWSSGTDLATDMIIAINGSVTNDTTKTVLYRTLYKALCNADWDNEDEVHGLDPVFDRVVKQINNRNRIRKVN